MTYRIILKYYSKMDTSPPQIIPFPKTCRHHSPLFKKKKSNKMSDDEKIYLGVTITGGILLVSSFILLPVCLPAGIVVAIVGGVLFIYGSMKLIFLK